MSGHDNLEWLGIEEREHPLLGKKMQIERRIVEKEHDILFRRELGELCEEGEIVTETLTFSCRRVAGSCGSNPNGEPLAVLTKC